MKNIIMGTAGHIDHGKTTLVKFLTGKDTDTLPDEKKRGITIDLGFSYMNIPDESPVGIIDVPGHEKFIKNMTAGIIGIDYLIFVVACDDGIMPQTVEHLNIAELLGVKKGVTVLTKTDFFQDDKDKIFEREKEIRNFVRGTFLENAPIIKTSIKNIETYKRLKKFIADDIKKIKAENKKIEAQRNFEDKKEFRMYVDRCFSVKGFGTVVTGTTRGKAVSVGDSINIYPLNIKAKIKGIENHSVKLTTIEAGNRGAFNLTGVEKEQIKRGDVLSSAEKFLSSQRIDVMFQSLENISVKNNQRVRVHLGTREIMGRIRFFGRDFVNEKGRYPAQIFLEEEAAGEYGELGLIRNYSPMMTLGGIKILNVLGEKTKRSDEKYLEKLEILDKFPEKAREITDDKIIETEKLENILKNYHEKNIFQRGILRPELKNRYFNNMSYEDFRNFIEKNTAEGVIKSEKFFEKEYISLKNFKIKLTKEQKNLKENIFKKYKETMFSLENYSQIKNELLGDDFFKEKEFDLVHNYMMEEGMIVPLGENYFILSGFLKEAEKLLKTYLKENKKITIKEFRELLKINRKSALLILEKLDNINITERINDYRVLK